MHTTCLTSKMLTLHLTAILPKTYFVAKEVASSQAVNLEPSFTHKPHSLYQPYWESLTLPWNTNTDSHSELWHKYRFIHRCYKDPVQTCLSVLNIRVVTKKQPVSNGLFIIGIVDQHDLSHIPIVSYGSPHCNPQKYVVRMICSHISK